MKLHTRSFSFTFVLAFGCTATDQANEAGVITGENTSGEMSSSGDIDESAETGAVGSTAGGSDGSTTGMGSGAVEDTGATGTTSGGSGGSTGMGSGEVGDTGATGRSDCSIGVGSEQGETAGECSGSTGNDGVGCSGDDGTGERFGPGCENFEGPYADRDLRVTYYDEVLAQHREEVWKFPNFDPLIGIDGNITGDERMVQFAVTDSSKKDMTREIVQIRTDPADPSNHVLWLKTTCCAPNQGTGKYRNEIHYRNPHGNAGRRGYQPNDTKYTFAFRFYKAEPSDNWITLMQAYSYFPWLRVRMDQNNNLFLNLAQCKDGFPYQATGSSCGGTGWDNWVFLDKNIGSFDYDTWNELVVNVLHHQDPNQGIIDVYLNGTKLVSWKGKTTFTSSDDATPFLKFGPYGGAAELFYDDVHVLDVWDTDPFRTH